MRGYWAQPSLSRDFALLSAAIVFVLFLISGWITYTTYTEHANRIAAEMEQEASRIERALAGEMESASYMLSALGRQIVLDKDRDLVELAQTLKSFDSKGYIYSIFSWISPEQYVIVSSNRGVLEKPMNVSDRDYVKKSMVEPWKMNIGRPIEGRVSERWIIPVAMGLTDYTGKFIGTIMVSIDINVLTERLSNLVKRNGISFAIVSKTLIPLTQVSDDKDFVTHNFPTQKLANVNFSTHPTGLVTHGSLFWGTGNYSFYRVSNDYPYIVLLGYDSHYNDETMHSMLWSRLVQIALIAIFLVLFLWIMRVRMVKPVLEMTQAASAVALGEPYRVTPMRGPIEIEGLSAQIRRISEYIEEIRRIEDELRNKMFMMKRTKEKAEMDRKSKSEFLAYVCQEMRNPLNNIIGFAQVMRDQLYGPIENRKYRQYAADIYQTGNHLLNNLQDLLRLSQTESGQVGLAEKPLDVSQVVKKALQYVNENMAGEKITIKANIQEQLPRLIADEFRLQQIISNLLIYAAKQPAAGKSLVLQTVMANENKDKAFLALVIGAPETTARVLEYLPRLAEKLMENSAYMAYKPDFASKDQTDLNLEIARLLIAMHQGYLYMGSEEDDPGVIVVLFAGNRMRFNEE